MSLKGCCGYLVFDKKMERRYRCIYSEKADINTKLINQMGIKYCDTCKRRCGGIYPSQLPTVTFDSSIIDIIDKNGNKID